MRRVRFLRAPVARRACPEGCAALRDLRSFPTRRSSDLKLAALNQAGDEAARGPVRGARGSSRALYPLEEVDDDGVCFDGGDAFADDRDLHFRTNPPSDGRTPRR